VQANACIKKIYALSKLRPREKYPFVVVRMFFYPALKYIYMFVPKTLKPLSLWYLFISRYALRATVSIAVVHAAGLHMMKEEKVPRGPDCEGADSGKKFARLDALVLSLLREFSFAFTNFLNGYYSVLHKCFLCTN
jgi:hypothetical protein